MPSEAVHQLLERGERSGLFSTSAAQVLISQMTADEALTVEDVAARMIEKKVLTRYQAEQLLAGHGDECLIAGRYRILEKLGEGGMGAVYKAHDTQLDRDVAVKVLPGHHLKDADAVARFQREARALAKLSHPNIIQAYDSGEDIGRHFLVMEYVEGASLAAILRERGALPPTLAADMIYQAALGLQHAHARGLVHRDLKPANLLWSAVRSLAGSQAPAAKEQARPSQEFTTTYVAPDALPRGIVKILDLGLARFLQDQLGSSQVTKEGVGVGTPDYMAPEQFRDALHADAPTDIYGLGCTLYQLISGTVPFPGSSFSEKADAHAKKVPIPLEERCPEVPVGLAFVVSKMMAKHPADRFQTAGEVAEALAPYIAGASHSAIQLRQTMRFHAGQLTMRGPSRRKRLLAWAGAAVAAACLAGLLILAWPNIFRRGVPTPQDDSQVQSTEPAAEASEPTKPEVKTIDNGLTVAKDGSGQYTTIRAALEKVKPGQTIRVLDDAVYTEAVSIDNRGRMEGLTLESPRGATLMMPPGPTIGLLVFNVPGITVRGFRLRTEKGPDFLCTVGGRSPGATLEALDFRVEKSSCIGVSVEQLNLVKGDAPVTVRNCVFGGLYRGIRVSGASNAGAAAPSRRVVLRDNDVSDCVIGIWMAGLVSDVHVVGNRMWNCSSASIQIEDLYRGSSGLLIANNSIQSQASGIQIQDMTQSVEPVAIVNNLILAEAGTDLEYLGKDRKYVSALQLNHNWRELRSLDDKTPEEEDRIPLAPQDVRRKEIAGIARDPKDASKFLRPAKDSPLASGGAGGDLPVYVGAVPPEGVEPWEWQKTWNARAAKSSNESKTGKD
jgi:eukaryotic-like serine/threonine-protein kinase